MTKKQVAKLIDAAMENVRREISDNAAHGGRFAAGLAGEGYAGGYLAALSDVQLLLNGAPPCVRPNYWRSE